MADDRPKLQPQPINTGRWKRVDHDKKIEKFIVTVVVMPDIVKPDEPHRHLIHWRGGGAYSQVLGTGEVQWRSTSFDTIPWRLSLVASKMK